MPNLRKVRVTLQDVEGVSHSTTVTATSVNEAIGLALVVFRREEWAAMIPEMTKVLLEVQPPAVEHSVDLRKWWKWLEARGNSPAEVSLRQRIRELLR